MKAIFLVRKGPPEKAFEIRKVKTPQPQEGQVLIKVEGFGLNFADIVAREGMYRDAPPMPSVLGYDVVGRIEAFGKNVSGIQSGDRVVALTRFGGYAEYALTDSRAIAKIPDSLNIAEACSLATQFITAYYCAAEAANLREGEQVIVHSAAGGVGSALMQYCKFKKCEVIATTGSASKVDLLKQQGAAHVLNTSTENFYTRVKELAPGGVDTIFDALGGKFIKSGIKLLSPAGRIVCYGASQMTGTNLFNRVRAALQFGFYHPAEFMMSSKSLIGVNMLHIADKKPELLQHCLQQVMKLHAEGILSPMKGKIFPASEIAAAHRYLQERKAIGKVALAWE
jgi:NADPH:quinone reductase-like Zn-dependent oxidoreductase